MPCRSPGAAATRCPRTAVSCSSLSCPTPPGAPESFTGGLFSLEFPHPSPLSVYQICVAVPYLLTSYLSSLTEAKLPAISDETQGKKSAEPALLRSQLSSPVYAFPCQGPGGARGRSCRRRLCRGSWQPQAPSQHSTNSSGALCIQQATGFTHPEGSQAEHLLQRSSPWHHQHRPTRRAGDRRGKMHRCQMCPFCSHTVFLLGEAHGSVGQHRLGACLFELTWPSGTV